MNDRDPVLASVRPDRKADFELNPSQLFSVFHEYKEEVLLPLRAENCLHLCAGGSNEIDWPFAVGFTYARGFLLLHTIDGSIRLQSGRQSVSSDKDSCLLLDGRIAWQLESRILPWTFELLVFCGAPADFFTSLLSRTQPAVLASEQLPVVSLALHELLAMPEQTGQRELLLMNQKLNTILTAFCQQQTAEPVDTRHLPAYLCRMHHMITEEFDRNYTLARYEELLQISRYRLCREYTAAFGISPLQDLNQHRITEAKKMLISTDLQIQEISSRIGFDNVTHFIRIFQKAAGMTPGNYRRTERRQGCSFPS